MDDNATTATVQATPQSPAQASSSSTSTPKPETKPSKPTESLTIKVNDQLITGWTSVRVTRSCERFPSDFSIQATVKDLTGKTVYIQPFNLCEVYLGNDKILTGYVDVRVNRISSTEHTLYVTGRSKCEDLVDCSAELPGRGDTGIPVLSYYNKTLYGTAEAMAKVYGIKIVYKSKQQLQVIPRFDVNVGETPYELIEKIARSQNLLVYDDVDGNVVLADVGDGEMGSGFEYGQNIEAMSIEQNFCQRYSEINVFDQTINALGLIDNPPLGTALDPNIRHRRLMAFSEAPFVNSQDWTQKRANWEMTRRQGRSQVAHFTVDSWRDGKGKLWEPNYYATIEAQYMELSKARWIIATVSYILDERGTHADVVMMPPDAFSIEPTVLAPLNPAFAIDVNPNTVGQTTHNEPG